MKKQENENEWITFAHCFSCNRIATVGSKIYDFNYIITLLDICTKIVMIVISIEKTLTLQSCFEHILPIKLHQL